MTISHRAPLDLDALVRPLCEHVERLTREPDRWVTPAQVAEHVAEHRDGNAPDVRLVTTVLQHAARLGFLEHSQRLVTEGQLTGNVLHFRVPASPVVAALDVVIAVQHAYVASSRAGQSWVCARRIADTTKWRRPFALLVAALEAAVKVGLLESRNGTQTEDQRFRLVVGPLQAGGRMADDQADGNDVSEAAPKPAERNDGPRRERRRLTVRGRARKVLSLLEQHENSLATREVRDALGCGNSERARSKLRRALNFAHRQGWVTKRRAGRDNRWSLTSDRSWRGAA